MAIGRLRLFAAALLVVGVSFSCAPPKRAAASPSKVSHPSAHQSSAGWTTGIDGTFGRGPLAAAWQAD